MIKISDLIAHLEDRLNAIENFLEKIDKEELKTYTRGCKDEIITILAYVNQFKDKSDPTI